MTASPTAPSRAGWRGIIDEYRSRLPLGVDVSPVTLLEGGTPLIRAERLSERLSIDLYVKIEGANPTGSFKDRGMTMAMTQAKADGAEAVVCASTGNTSASAAAYAAKAGITCAVLVPSGRIAMGKLAQALVYGARLLQVEGSFDDCLDICRALAQTQAVTLVNSVNPARIAGQKTAAYEVCDVLQDAPDIHCLPVGNAGNITAYWAGYQEYASEGLTTRLPRMFGFQAAGSAPLVSGERVLDPQTIASAIRIGNPASWSSALAARDDSRGLIHAVTDAQILAAWRTLARDEAIFVEPSSATSLAGLLQAHAQGLVPLGSRVVCTVTGNGLKDTDTVLSSAPAATTVPASLSAVAGALGLS